MTDQPAVPGGQNVPPEPGGEPRQWNQLALGFSHFAGAAAITYIFIIILMTAIAQQNAVAELAKGGAAVGYSSAYATRLELVQRTGEARDLRRQLAEQLARIPRLADERSAAQGRYEIAWRAFFPLARRAASSCAVNLGEGDTVDARLGLWHEIMQCRTEGAMVETLGRSVDALASSLTGFGNAADELAVKERAFAHVEQRVDALRRQIIEKVAMSPEERAAWHAFDEMTVLQSSWVFAWGLLVPLPPSLLLLLLSFFAGAFGALLVTLVLIVYPASAISIASAGLSLNRVLLGALISVCVYILMLGGTSVLGAASGLDAARVNYMAYCAVGVLAGMFSDRVAKWLSDRAKHFFPEAS